MQSRRPSPRLLGLLVGIAALACSPAPKREPGAAATGGSAGSSVGTAGATLGIGTGGASGSMGNIDACVAETSMAEPAPLDIYLMLDISGSMLSEGGGGEQKWTAVKNAITAFLRDPGSDNIGVGIQYFPLRKPGVPASCQTNADCGSGGSCLLSACEFYSTDVPGGIAQCDEEAECGQIPAAVDYGPCAQNTCQANGTMACAKNEDCWLQTQRNFGRCMPLGQCESDRGLICQNLGGRCMDAADVDLGECLPVETSVCFHGEQCETSAYATPAVPIAPLAESRDTLIASIEAQNPDGDTPSAPALRGAIQHARERAAAQPGHNVVAVLATDGLPTDCLPNDVKFSGTVPTRELVREVAGIAAEGVLSSPSIATFVIGVFSQSDSGAPENLTLIAQAGGTQNAQIVDTSGDVTQQFLHALNSIRTSRLACDYRIPEPEAGKDLDYHAVNVDLAEGETKTPLYYVRTPDRCDAEGGWYYDDLAGTAPTRILVCPSTCERFQDAGTASVNVALGCTTRVK